MLADLTPVRFSSHLFLLSGQRTIERIRVFIPRRVHLARVESSSPVLEYLVAAPGYSTGNCEDIPGRRHRYIAVSSGCSQTSLRCDFLHICFESAFSSPDESIWPASSRVVPSSSTSSPRQVTVSDIPGRRHRYIAVSSGCSQTSLRCDFLHICFCSPERRRRSDLFGWISGAESDPGPSHSLIPTLQEPLTNLGDATGT
jgi:hypothetical protein